MPRIPDAEVSRLKQAVPLTRLVEARGVVLKGDGHNLMGLCPFHDDTTPSLAVDPVKNLWHCLGACACGGSAIDWVMKDHGVAFRTACEIIAAMAGGAPYPARPAGHTSGAMKQTSARRLVNPFSPDADGDVLLAQVADFYHRTLLDNPLATSAVAMDYLRSRKIADEAVLRKFRIGYADRSLGLRIPDKARREGAQLRIRMNKIGLLKENGHEQFFGAVTVPISTEAGAVVGMYGRMTSDHLRTGTVYHRYLSGPHRAAWNAAGAIDPDGAVILCESLIDGLTFACHGFPHVTAAYGVNGFTEHHRRLIASDAVKTVFIAYDNDDAGNAAALLLADEVIGMGRTVYRVTFPADVKDANGLAMASDEPAAALGAALRSAVFLGGPVRVSVPAWTPAPAVTPVPVPAPAPAHKESSAAKIEKTSVASVVPVLPPVPPVIRPLAALPAAVSAVAVPAAPRRAAISAPASTPVSAPASPGLLVADGDEFRAAIGSRRYRIRSLLKNSDAAALKIGLRLTVTSRDGIEFFHQDTVDLCHAKQRAAFMAAAAEATKADAEAIKTDLGQLLNACETAWEAHRRAATSPGTLRPPMDAEAEAAAYVFLRSSDLLGRIAADYDACGIVGESAPKLVSYLCAVSRKLDQPLAVLTMAPSAAGKTSLQDGTLAFIPEEERLCLSAMTGQALHYIEDDLSHRVLAIAEEEGASRAAYSLKLLQSEGKISLAVPIKDAETGQIVTKIKEVRGPVALFLTTTAPQIDEELANRCIVLTVDESPEQTARVHAAQRERETLDGLLRRSRAEAIRTVHQNAQRLLESVAIVNPYARFLTFRADRPRTRRDHMKYLGLIRSITFLHQHQRPRHTVQVAGCAVAYIEVTLADIAAANHLAAAVLGRSLDELAPQTRTLLLRLDALVSAIAARDGIARERVRFTRRVVREFCQWSADQTDVHLARLERLEYVLAHHGGQGARYVYSLAYDGQGQDGKPFMMGLCDVAALADQTGNGADSSGMMSTSVGVDPHFRPMSDPVPGGVRGPSVARENDKNDGENQSSSDYAPLAAVFDPQGGIKNAASYHTPNRLDGAA